MAKVWSNWTKVRFMLLWLASQAAMKSDIPGITALAPSLMCVWQLQVASGEVLSYSKDAMPASTTASGATGRLLNSATNTAPAAAPASLLSAEAQFLLQLKGNLSDPQKSLDDWSNEELTNVCQWTGVVCDQFSRVQHVNLSGLNLAGNLSASIGNISHLVTLNLSFNRFTGELPDSLGLLTQLQHLDLGFNRFTGPIPVSLSACRELTYLALQSNQLSGSILSGLGQLSDLQHLNLSSNSLVGEIPPSLGDCTNLRSFDLSSNTLTGPIPPSLSNCSFLSVLILADNSLDGSIPSLSSLVALQLVDLSDNLLTGFVPKFWPASNLTELHMSSNQLAGEIPEELGSLANLEVLDFSRNNLSGIIPNSLANCKLLQLLDLSWNQLQGSIPFVLGNSLFHLKDLYLHKNNLSGEIPSSLQNCTGLVSLSLDRNQGLTGNIPSWLNQLQNLTQLSLYNCAFRGSFPDLSRTPFLEKIYLDNNQLDGPIPPDIGTWWPNIITIYASGNMLTGSIPASLGLCQKLQILSLISNRLTGNLPIQLGNSVSLFIVSLGANLLSGTIPKTFGNLSLLQQLNLRDNQLHGVIPDELSSCRLLEMLDLSGNAFNGSLPPWLGLLNNTLTLFSVRHNQLRGGIPMELGYCTKLQELYLSYNELTGGIPLSFASLRNLAIQFDLSHNMLSGPLLPQLGSLRDVQVMNLSFNQLSGTIPSTLSGCTGLQILDLSNNMLEGDIPPSLGPSAGSSQWLKSILVMNFSSNSIGGSIPQELGGLETLQSLDLSNNRLSGRIPESLADLSSLSFFNLSYNDLSGEVPTTGAFSDLTVESFLGNPGLCGELLHRQCGKSRWARIQIWVIVALVLGISACASVFGCILVCWCRRAQPQVKGDIKDPEDDMLVFDSQFDFSVHDLWVATDGYSESRVIGSGSVSVVYQATLTDGRQVAVKKIKVEETVGTIAARTSKGDTASLLVETEVSRSFVTELQLLGRLRHRNLVRLLGCQISTTGAVKAIVLEHLQRGNLEQALYGKQTSPCSSDKIHAGGRGNSYTPDDCLSWKDRLSIALDVALGLVYLHFECPEPVIHCDLKPANILLDEEKVAHIGDFGIARVLATDMTVPSVLESKFRGSFGYIAPEYAFSLHINTSGDVYSYGIVLLELLTERRPTSHTLDLQPDIREWAREVFAQRNANLLAPTLLRSILLSDTDDMFLLLKVGILCTEMQPSARPTMREVLVMLDNIKSLSESRRGGIVSVASRIRSLEELANTPPLA